MNKKTLIGLGVCALAFGAVIGAVSARPAIEARADVEITSWNLAGGVNSWNLSDSNYAFSHDTENGVWTLSVDLPESSPFKIVANHNWNDCQLWWQFADNSAYINKDGSNAYSTDAGTYTFTIKDTLTPTIGGNYEKVPSYIGVTYVEKEVVVEITSWNLPGSFNSWKADENEFSYDSVKGEYSYEIALEANDEFKIVANGKWGDCELGWQLADAEISEYLGKKDTNALAIAAGNYTFIIKDTLTVAIAASSAELKNYITVEYDSGIVDTDFPAENGYYLLGDENFTGSAETAWKFAGGVKMSAPEEGTDLGVLLNKTIAAGSKVKARSYDGTDRTWYTVGSGTLDFGAPDEEGNFVFSKAGKYNFYLNSEGKLYVTLAEAEKITSDDVIYIASGRFVGEAYLYNWIEADIEKGIEFEENAAYPGVKISEIEGAKQTSGMNFNGMGDIWTVPVSGLIKDSNIIISAHEDEVENVKTVDLGIVGGTYYAMTGEAQTPSAAIANQAVVVNEIYEAINKTANKSVCEVAKEDAVKIVADYDALNHATDLIDAATYWTHAGSKIAESDEDRADVTLNLILAQLVKIAEAPEATAWNISHVSGNTNLVVTLAIVLSGIVLAGGLYFVYRRRRSN